MIERVIDYMGYLVRLPAHPAAKDAILFLHGFPGSKAVKNLDVALLARAKFDQDIFLTHYTGLGESPGDFLFTTSILETASLVKWLIEVKGYNKIHLVGHSWGGLVAVNCAIAHPKYIGSLLLISPFCHTQPEDPLYRWFIEDIETDYPGVFGRHQGRPIQSDFEKVVANYLPLARAPHISKEIKIAILQSKGDDVTPAHVTKQFASRLQNSPQYTELDQDHGFMQDRLEFSQTINRLLMELLR